jgi:hypothetical protein
MSEEISVINIGCNMKTYDVSKTKVFVKLKELEKKRITKNFDNREEQRNINIRIDKAKIDLEGDLDCINCGKEFKNLNSILKHEKECLELEHNIDLSQEEKQKLYSDASITCKFCKKVFLHTCKTSLPKHQLKRHAITCQKSYNRKLKQEIKESLNDLENTSILQKIVDEIAKLKKN